MNYKNVIIIFLSLFIFCFILLEATGWVEPVEAASSFEIKGGCYAVGTIGVVIIARCYDEETDTIFYGNSAGWLSEPIDY